ncbi:hypothetical protein PF001_g27898 [Phytophthora fragariae]|uniref:Uncharacterized protein n=1 Tax=Phytophthora fragariae TaxID=53985 RepID=A0A6A3HGX2_9STRA|nr:hypothetical protein PF011_g27309 [Phytophthora fragariae]KAE9177710.1 hypothetical protein PF004_g25696 [Phytophthora fragariae]KAE9272532.1 hypothetical protein PF001_g27898 [Phytophthora fragariae]
MLSPPATSASVALNVATGVDSQHAPSDACAGTPYTRPPMTSVSMVSVLSVLDSSGHCARRCPAWWHPKHRPSCKSVFFTERASCTPGLFGLLSPSLSCNTLSH